MPFDQMDLGRFNAIVIESVPGGEWVEYRLDTSGGRGFWRFAFDEAEVP